MSTPLIGLRSRKHIASFDLLRPETVADAAAAGAAEGSAFLAGGIDLIDRLKSGTPLRRMISLASVPSLRAIRREADGLVIGALATHDAITTDLAVAEAIPDLPPLWRKVANPRIRFTGTIGGNLVSGYPHYDGFPAMLALGASVVVAGLDGAPAETDAASVADLRGHLLLAVRIPTGAEPPRLLADRTLHPTVSVYLGANVEGGMLRAARVAVGCCFPEARVAPLAVAGLALARLGGAAAELAEAVANALGEPKSDGLASGAYRRRMIAVLTRRLLVRLGANG